MARGSRCRALAAALAAAGSLPRRTASSASGSPQVGYERLEYGRSGCPEGREVTSEAECLAAVVDLGVVSSASSSNFWAGSYRAIPRQCSLHEFDLGYGSSGGHWNGAPTGQGRADLAPVCRVQADAHALGAGRTHVPQAFAALGPRTVHRLTGSCALPSSGYRASATCGAAHRRFWEDRRSQYGMNCVLDPDSLRMNCSVEDTCAGESYDKEVEVRHSVLYDCKRCDRDGETFHRLSCCSTCLALKKKGIPVEGGWGNYSVQCGGCGDLQGLQEQAEKAKSRYCKVEAGKVNCTFSHRCDLGSPRKTQHVTSCARTPCDRCGADGPMRAECCSACLEIACGSNSTQRHVCMGCDATRDLPEEEQEKSKAISNRSSCSGARDNSVPEVLTTTPQDVRGDTSTELPEVEENVTTVLVDEAPAGSNVVRVESEDQLTFGDRVRITGGGLSETRTILAFGSVVLCSPLEHSYPAGSSVTKTGSTYALGSDVGSAPQPKKGMWSSWFWEDGSVKLWQLLLVAGLVISALAIVPATCAAHYQRRGRRIAPRSRGTPRDRLCEGGADGESDEEVEEPLMASFSEALKQGPFQSCATPASSPVQHTRTGGSTPGAPLRPVVATAIAATPPLYACQLPPVHIAHVTSFSQKVCTQAGGCSYKPLRCQSPHREPRSPQLVPRSP